MMKIGRRKTHFSRVSTAGALKCIGLDLPVIRLYIRPTEVRTKSPERVTRELRSRHSELSAALSVSQLPFEGVLAMTAEFDRLFAQDRAFGWNNEKRNSILRERGIDFEDMRFVFDDPIIALRSDRGGEARYMVCGFLDGREVVVVCTFRDDVCWIITARRARRDERKKYHDRLSRRPPPKGQD